MKSGYKVGLFTSPHLNDFRERITINNKYITKEFIFDFYNKYFEEISTISSFLSGVPLLHLNFLRMKKRILI